MDDFPGVLAAAQRGDEVAFTAIYRVMQPMLLRYLTVLGGSGSAEDLAAETWISALRGLTAFTGDESGFRGYLVTIARARWVDAVRADARRPEDVVDALPEQRADDDVSSEVMARASTEEALALVRQLPADQAEVVMLRMVADLDVAEVAEVVGKTPNHVRVLCHRGLRKLEAMLGNRAVAEVEL